MHSAKSKTFSFGNLAAEFDMHIIYKYIHKRNDSTHIVLP